MQSQGTAPAPALPAHPTAQRVHSAHPPVSRCYREMSVDSGTLDPSFPRPPRTSLQRSGCIAASPCLLDLARLHTGSGPHLIKPSAPPLPPATAQSSAGFAVKLPQRWKSCPRCSPRTLPIPAGPSPVSPREDPSPARRPPPHSALHPPLAPARGEHAPPSSTPSPPTSLASPNVSTLGSRGSVTGSFSSKLPIPWGSCLVSGTKGHGYTCVLVLTPPAKTSPQISRWLIPSHPSKVTSLRSLL